jgi:hypothetical protein
VSAVAAKKRLAIVGAGPIGLAAALGGVRRGLEVTVFERDRVGASLLGWGPTRFFSTLAMNLPPGVAELLGTRLPPPDALLTGPEMVEMVLAPLAASVELEGRILEGHRVVAIGREGMLRVDYPGHPVRGERSFRLLVDTPAGERSFEADCVLDASGLSLRPALGEGGVPAPGERAAAATDRIVRDLGSLHRRRAQLAGKRVLLVGHGHSAANAIHLLEELAAQGTRVVWAVRALNTRPCLEVADDPLPERRTVVAHANQLAAKPPAWLRVERRAAVQAMAPDGEGALAVTLSGDRRVSVDAIVSLTGSRPDHEPLVELAVELAPTTEGAARLQRALANITDCLCVPAVAPDDLASGEPGFHLVGSKSYGRSRTFLLQTGYAQLETILDELARPPVG